MNPQDNSASQPQSQTGPSNDSQTPAVVPSGDMQGSSQLQQSDSSVPDPQYAEVALPAEAQDTDLIEKEWVERAKQIVDHTREDPYEQLRALSHMKADYLKKRYNKDIKIADD